jgi:hypothetical protein
MLSAKKKNHLNYIIGFNEGPIFYLPRTDTYWKGTISIYRSSGKLYIFAMAVSISLILKIMSTQDNQSKYEVLGNDFKFPERFSEKNAIS